MIKIIATGKMKDRRLANLIGEYARRITGMAPFAVEEVHDATPEREAREMLKKLGSAKGSQLVCALDERGERVTSSDLAELLGRRGAVAFLIGGADGLGAAACERAERTLRLSDLTLTHEMARLLLTEQIYRGLCILRNRPYHRD